jgi:hypothetical protein
MSSRPKVVGTLRRTVRFHRRLKRQVQRGFQFNLAYHGHFTMAEGVASMDTFNQQVVQVKDDRYDNAVLET